jgi:hypothetical protein
VAKARKPPLPSTPARKAARPARRKTPAQTSSPGPEIARYAVLAILSILLWCSVYSRWSADSWSIPVEYGWQGERADVQGNLAGLKVVMDGDFTPMVFHYVPQLGAPYTANWNDYPATEDFLFWFPGILARFIGLFAAANFAVMTVQVLGVLAFYYAARRLKCDWRWSYVGALIFGLAPFGFAHSLHHFVITAYGHIALGVLVFFWVSNGNGLRFRSRDYWIAIGIAVLTGCLNVYYTYIFIQMVGIGLIIQWLRHGWRATLVPFSIGCVTFATFVLMDLHSVLYGIVYGHNPSAYIRNYAQMELYALKLADCFMPFPTHKIPLFADIGRHFYSITGLSAEVPPACYFGLVGLAAFLWLAVYTVRNALIRTGRRIPLEATLVLWTFLYATVGGINGIVGAAGFEMFRSTTRYCIVILCVSLLFAVRRISLISRRWNSPWPVVAPVLIGIVGVWEFLPPLAGEDQSTTAAIVNSDRQFALRMESSLPKGAMVFQMPVMDYPETPIAGVPAYSHFRPFLYTKDLRYSFGSDKGRVQDAWQHVITGLAPADQIAALERYGFSAIYINRGGYPEKAAGLIAQYKAAGRDTIVDSQLQDLCFVVLKPSPNPVLPPPGPLFSAGWFPEQDSANGQRDHLATGDGVLILSNPTNVPLEQYANFYLVAIAPRTVTVQGGGAFQAWHVDQQHPVRVANLHFTLQPGENRITFTTDAPPTPPQNITFDVANFDLSDSPRPEQ